MKNFLNVFVILILVGLIIGTAWLQVVYGEAWFIGFLPLAVMSFAWGVKISQDYE